MMRSRRLNSASLVTAAMAALVCRPAQAQGPRDNIYRYILDIDIPESAGLVALDLLATKVLRGSAPKPFTANIVHRSADSSGTVTGVALDQHRQSRPGGRWLPHRPAAHR